MTANPCLWTADEEGNWNTACDHVFNFIEGGPVENLFRHCCYCGGKLLPKPYCDHNWKFIKSWGGDESIPNGTFDCSYYVCANCHEETDSEPADFVPDEPDEDARDKVRGIDE